MIFLRKTIVLSSLFFVITTNVFADSSTISGRNGEKVLKKIYQIKKRINSPLSVEIQKDMQREEIKKRQTLLINNNVQTIKRNIVATTSTSSATPIINVSPGFATSLIFLDVTGKPYPIQDYVVGGSKYFNVVKSKTGHILMINPKSLAAKTNLQVILIGKNSPVSVILNVADLSQDQVFIDDIVKITIPDRGPLSPKPKVKRLVDEEVAADGRLMSFLDKVPPSDAKRLDIKTDLSNQIVWKYKGEYYLRTRFNLFFPVYREMVISENNYKVYKTGTTLFFKLYLDDGNIGQIEVLDE